MFDFRLNLGKTDVAQNTRKQLLVNGSFTDVATGWVSMQAHDGVGSTVDGEGWQSFTTETGKTYSFSCVCDRAGVSPSISVKRDTESGTSLFVAHPAGTGWNTYSGEFTALSEVSVVHFGNGSNTALFDDVSVI